MNTNPKSRDRKLLAWPIAGIALIGFIQLVAPGVSKAMHITLSAGIAAWCADMALVAILSAHPLGARAGALMAGLFAAVPAFVEASGLARFLLMCSLALPLLGATELLLAPPIAGFTARLAYICTCFPTGQVKRRARCFDWAALQQILGATVVLAAAIAAIKALPAALGLWLLVRWLAGGIGILAFAEIATACLPLLTAPLGLTVPPLMQSPYRSTSVSEFWAKRWNVQASALFRRYLYAPIARHGAGLAMFITFAFSGAGHAALADLALGKWRTSMAWEVFFLVQPLFIAAERWMNVRCWPPAAGRAWTLTALTVASPLFVEPALQMLEKVWGPPGNVLQPIAAVLGYVFIVSGIISLAALKSPSAAA